jgi:hypothetical protein
MVLFSPSEMGKDELEIYSAVMSLMDENRKNPKRTKPYVEILKRVLLVKPQERYTWLE